MLMKSIKIKHSYNSSTLFCVLGHPSVNLPQSTGKTNDSKA